MPQIGQARRADMGNAPKREKNPPNLERPCRWRFISAMQTSDPAFTNRVEMLSSLRVVRKPEFCDLWRSVEARAKSLARFVGPIAMLHSAVRWATRFGCFKEVVAELGVEEMNLALLMNKRTPREARHDNTVQLLAASFMKLSARDGGITNEQRVRLAAFTTASVQLTGTDAAILLGHPDTPGDYECPLWLRTETSRVGAARALLDEAVRHQMKCTARFTSAVVYKKGPTKRRGASCSVTRGAT